MYSGRSIPRPRIFSMDQPASLNDDLRSHISHFSAMNGGGVKAHKPRYYNANNFIEILF